MKEANPIYEDYWSEGKHKTSEWTPEFFEETLGVLRTDSKMGQVLDYGCGMGYSYQRQLIAAADHYIGADVAESVLKRLDCMGQDRTLISSEGRVDIEDDCCDGAVCSEVFEHLWDPLAAARELRRILKPGGRLVATVPNFGYVPWRLMALLRAQVPMEPESPENRFRGVHIRFFSKLMLERLLKDAGFREVRCYGWCDANIWDVFQCAGPFGKLTHPLTRYLPRFTQLSFLGKLWPNVCAPRLRVTGVK